MSDLQSQPPLDKQDKQDTQEDVESPCVRNCCLDENDICLGCFRSYDEILQWYQATVSEKQAILERSSERKTLKPRLFSG